jgi:dienelactone hydrolase
VLLYAPVLKPLWQGAVFLVALYSQALLDRNLAAVITPPPRTSTESVTLEGVAMRVDWWRPGWGDRHPAVLLVNGAVEEGNAEPNVRRTADALARAGYLVMMAELPGLKALRLDPAAPIQVAAAARHVRARSEVDAARFGVFGLSIGAAAALAAAADPDVPDFAYVAALSPVFSADSFVASVITQTTRDGGNVVAWQPRADVRVGLQKALANALSDRAEAARITSLVEGAGGDVRGPPPTGVGGEAMALWALLATRDRVEAEARLRDLPLAVRAGLNAFDPSRAWGSIHEPVYLIHSPADDAEPVTESYAAMRAARPGTTRLLAPDLLHHGDLVSERARSEGGLFYLRELAAMLAFTVEVLRVAG